ncbi:hypothetical protein HK101_003905, partial [Irineochytrium annulatum]
MTAMQGVDEASASFEPSSPAYAVPGAPASASTLHQLLLDALLLSTPDAVTEPVITGAAARAMAGGNASQPTTHTPSPTAAATSFFDELVGKTEMPSEPPARPASDKAAGSQPGSVLGLLSERDSLVNLHLLIRERLEFELQNQLSVIDARDRTAATTWLESMENATREDGPGAFDQPPITPACTPPMGLNFIDGTPSIGFGSTGPGPGYTRSDTLLSSGDNSQHLPRHRHYGDGDCSAHPPRPPSQNPPPSSCGSCGSCGRHQQQPTPAPSPFQSLPTPIPSPATGVNHPRGFINLNLNAISFHQDEQGLVHILAPSSSIFASAPPASQQIPPPHHHFSYASPITPSPSPPMTPAFQPSSVPTRRNTHCWSPAPTPLLSSSKPSPLTMMMDLDFFNNTLPPVSPIPSATVEPSRLHEAPPPPVSPSGGAKRHLSDQPRSTSHNPARSAKRRSISHAIAEDPAYALPS